MSTAQSSEGENAALLAENAALLAENARLRRSADGAFACDPAGRAPRACTRTVYAVAVVAADAKFASLSVCFRFPFASGYSFAVDRYLRMYECW